MTSLADNKKAEDIAEKSVKANGGKEKFEALKSLTLTADLKIPAQGVEYKITFWMKKPDKMKILTDVPAAGMKLEAGTDGKVIWGTQPGSDKRMVVPESNAGMVSSQLQSFKGILDPPMLDYKEKGLTLAFKGLEDIDERKCNVITATDNNGSKTDFYFDAISNLVYSTKSVVDVNGENTSIVTKVVEYQRVEGMTIPKRIEAYQNDELQTKISVSGIKLNENYPDSDFSAGDNK